MKGLKHFFIFSLIGLTFGCNSAKSIIAKGELNTKLSSKQIIKEHEKQSSAFKTLQAKVKIEYIEGEKAQTHTVNLRIEKDKTIWLSATLGLARVKITPEKVRFYDKINNQFFDGDYSLLSDLLGTELNFYKVQSLLLGDAIVNLKEGTYIASTSEKSYTLHPKNQNPLFDLFLFMNPSHFKVDELQLLQPSENRMLKVDYKAYQEVEKQVLPKNIKISAIENTDTITINLEYKSVSLNSDLRFPFKIPSGYKEIIL